MPSVYVLSQSHTDDRNCGKQDDEDNGYIENQAFHSAPRLKHGTGAAASKGAAQSGTSRLEQDKDDYSNAENDLHRLQCRKPLSQILPRFRISTYKVIIYLFRAELYHTICWPSRLVFCRTACLSQFLFFMRPLMTGCT